VRNLSGIIDHSDGELSTAGGVSGNYYYANKNKRPGRRGGIGDVKVAVKNKHRW